MRGPSLATATAAEPRAPTFPRRAEAVAAELSRPTQMIKTETKRAADMRRAAGESSSRRLADVLSAGRPGPPLRPPDDEEVKDGTFFV